MRTITLFKALEELTIEDKDILKEIIDSLEDKKFDIEFREPMSSGITHDKWEDKYYSILSLYDEAEYIYNTIYERTDDDIEELICNIENYQDEYGGLKTLKLYLY